MDQEPVDELKKTSNSPTESRHQSRHLRKVLIPGVVGIGLILLVLWFGKSQFEQSWNSITLPQELKGVILVSNHTKTAVAYRPSTLGYARVPYEAGTASAIIRSGAHFLTVVPAQNAPYTLEEDGLTRVRSTSLIRGVSETPTTGMIAYGVMSAAESAESHGAPPDGPFTNPALWDINVRFANGTTTRIVSGYAPTFLTDTTLIFLSSTGVYRYDLSSGEAKKIIDRRFPEIFGTVLQSPDRTLIAFSDPIKKVTDVYKIQSGDAALVMEVPDVVISPALSNDALYSLKATQQGGEVWKYPLGTTKPQLIHLFPRSLGVGRIVF